MRWADALELVSYLLGAEHSTSVSPKRTPRPIGLRKRRLSVRRFSGDLILSPSVAWMSGRRPLRESSPMPLMPRRLMAVAGECFRGPAVDDERARGVSH